MGWSFASTVKHQAAALCNIRQTLDNIDNRDLLFFFNECYNTLYRRVCRKDAGFYALRERLDVLKKHTPNATGIISGTDSITLPDYVLEVTDVYEAREEFDSNRRKYQNADSWARGGSHGVYVLEGRTLFVDTSFATNPVWVEYIPAPAVITWPIKNHEPQILELSDVPVQPETNTIGYTRIEEGLKLTDLKTGNTVDMRIFFEDDEWEYKNYLVSDPYLIVNFSNRILPDKYQIRIYTQLFGGSFKYSLWDAFAWQGRPTNCEALYAVHNDYTLGDMIVRDWADGGKIKKLGFFPDTKINYPSSVMLDLLTYMLADRIAKLSMIDSPLIEDGLMAAWDSFEKYTKVNRAAFRRIEIMKPFSVWM